MENQTKQKRRQRATLLRTLLRLIQALTPDWQILIAPILAASGIALGSLPITRPGFDLGSVADMIPDPAEFIEHRLFNPELICR